MKIIDRDVSKILKDEQNDFQSYLSFLKDKSRKLGQDNLVIDLSDVDLDLEKLLKLLPISEKHKENHRSFVVVTAEVDIDRVPEELSVVPTLGEAEDLIQMEEIERDLGF